MITHVIALREIGTDRYAREADDGTMIFSSLCARTLFFDREVDDEVIAAHRSAAPHGHDSVEPVLFERTLRLIAQP